MMPSVVFIMSFAIKLTWVYMAMIGIIAVFAVVIPIVAVVTGLFMGMIIGIVMGILIAIVMGMMMGIGSGIVVAYPPRARAHAQQRQKRRS
jgi:MFS superfamily sulfate permease-like transporter